jgi:hypothetical protein
MAIGSDKVRNDHIWGRRPILRERYRGEKGQSRNPRGVPY